MLSLRSLVSDSFTKIHINDKINVSVKAICRVAAKKMLNKALQIRREHTGSLLQATRLVQSMELTDKNDFGDSCHMASTEPFFYDSSYKPVKREYIYFANRGQWDMHHRKESVHIW